MFFLNLKTGQQEAGKVKGRGGAVLYPIFREAGGPQVLEVGGEPGLGAIKPRTNRGGAVSLLGGWVVAGPGPPPCPSQEEGLSPQPPFPS